MKKKQIIKELENLYVVRLDDYRNLMSAGEYEEAQRAFNDTVMTLAKINEIRGKKAISVTDISSIVAAGANIANVGITACDLASANHWRNETFEFEKNGTISSTGGKRLLADSFQRIKPKKF